MSLRSEGKFALVPEWLLYADVNATSIRLYAVLSRHADKDTFVAWPSRRTLATKMRCSKDTVDRCIKELIKVGALRVEERFDEESRQTSNLYTVLLMPRGGRTSAQGGGRIDAQGVAAPTRPRTIVSERESYERSKSAIAKTPKPKTKTMNVDGESVEFTWTGERWEEAV